MACIIQGIVVIIIVYVCCILPLICHIHSYVTKTQSIDIISLVFAINVDLFEQVFKICYTVTNFLKMSQNAGISVHHL